MKKLYLSGFFILLSACLAAQPPEIYFGGVGDGFHFAAFTADSTIYSAGPSDGFASEEYLQGTSIFKGGNSDGFAAISYLNPSSIFVASTSDGFSLGSYSNTNLLTRGGDADGFGMEYFLYFHDWTGLVGTGWLVAGNWAYDIIPTENARVRIPSAVPNFPAVNSGTFTIGAATGKYKCRGLLIEPAAQLTIRVNAITEIYNKVKITN